MGRRYNELCYVSVALLVLLEVAVFRIQMRRLGFCVELVYFEDIS